MTKDLKVMDATAIAFCRDNKHPDRGVRHVVAGTPAGHPRGEQVGTMMPGLTADAR